MFKKKGARCWGGRSRLPTRTRSFDGSRASARSYGRHRVRLRGSRRGSRFVLLPACIRSGAAPRFAPPSPARPWSKKERKPVRPVLNSPRFQDCAPAAIQATLLDAGQYLCSTRTMYRFLEQDGSTRERRDQLTHPAYQKPELLATAPNQLWSWDITKLRGPAKWTYYY